MKLSFINIVYLIVCSVPFANLSSQEEQPPRMEPLKSEGRSLEFNITNVVSESSTSSIALNCIENGRPASMRPTQAKGHFVTHMNRAYNPDDSDSLDLQ